VLTDGSVVVVELAGDTPERVRLLLIDPRAGRSAWRDDVRTWKLDARGLEINRHVTPASQLAAILGS